MWLWIGRGALVMLGIGGTVGIARGVSSGVKILTVVGGTLYLIYWMRK